MRSLKSKGCPRCGHRVDIEFVGEIAQYLFAVDTLARCPDCKLIGQAGINARTDNDFFIEWENG